MRVRAWILTLTFLLSSCGSLEIPKATPEATRPEDLAEVVNCQNVDWKWARQMIENQSQEEQSHLLAGCEDGQVACAQRLEEFFLSHGKRVSTKVLFALMEEGR